MRGVGKICEIQRIKHSLHEHVTSSGQYESNTIDTIAAGHLTALSTDLDFVLLGFQTCTVAVAHFHLH